MAEYIERAAAVKVVLRERKPTNSVAQNRMLSIIQRDLLTMRAAYEDTGLEPEQCENAKAIIESAFSDDTSKAERIRELLKADKDGRLVVLPCKVGDGLWTCCSHPVEQVYSFTVTDISTLNGRTVLNTSLCGVIDARDVGKTVFLTREEAEEALEAMKDE